MMPLDDAVRDLYVAVRDAEAKHGNQDHLPWMTGRDETEAWRAIGLIVENRARHGLDGDATWCDILMEEVGELLQTDNPGDRYAEALQVAAMALNVARLALTEIDREAGR